MVKHLLALVAKFKVGLVELAGAATLAGSAAAFDVRAGGLVAGVFVLAKSMEMDLRRERGEP